MKVGDLVRYVDASGRNEWHNIGIVLREIPGTDQYKVVRWDTGIQSSYPMRNLETISENR
jgi:hypothetical protein